MADTATKSVGRPKKTETASVEAKKRPAPTPSETNGTPAKRGRGRPKKGVKKPKKVYVKKGNAAGRGRPPKNAAKKDVKKSSEDDSA